MLCKFCGKECKNNNSLRNHERLCRSNPNRQNPATWNSGLGRKGTNHYTKAKELGLAKPEMSKETRLKLSEGNKKRTPAWHKENGKKISKTIQKKVAEGTWHTSLAKHMHKNYNGINLHGSWELAYAQYLDKNKILWIRNTKSFSYQFSQKHRKYTPDFYLPELDEYIEIKGYKVEKDEAKWSQFPKHLKLRILMAKELKELGVI